MTGAERLTIPARQELTTPAPSSARASGPGHGPGWVLAPGDATARSRCCRVQGQAVWLCTRHAAELLGHDHEAVKR